MRKQSIYPFADWLDGKERTLYHHVHFMCQPWSMQTYLYAEAKRRGLKVTLRWKEGTIRIVSCVPRPKKIEITPQVFPGPAR